MTGKRAQMGEVFITLCEEAGMSPADNLALLWMLTTSLLNAIENTDEKVARAIRAGMASSLIEGTNEAARSELEEILKSLNAEYRS